MEKLKTKLSTAINSVIASGLLLLSTSSQAALPADFQNEKDLADMVAHIKADHEVLSGLSLIDLAELTVYYGENCRVRFARKVVEREAGWVGPAEPIEFKSKECPENSTMVQAPVPDSKVKAGMIVSVEAGDTACYLQIKDHNGAMHSEMAVFDLCDDASLINKSVEFEYEQGSVMAASCEGNPECGESETVWLVAQAKRI